MWQYNYSYSFFLFYPDLFPFPFVFEIMYDFYLYSYSCSSDLDMPAWWLFIFCFVFVFFYFFFFHFYSLWLQNLKVKSWQIAFSDIIFFILILKVQKDVPHWALVWHSRCSFSVSSCWKHLVVSAAELKHKPQTPWQTLRSWQQLLVNESSSWAS